MALLRRTGQRVTSSIWTGYVDAMTGLLLVFMFVLSMFMIVQYILSGTISSQSDELLRRERLIADLNSSIAIKDAELLRQLNQIQQLLGDTDASKAQIASLEYIVRTQLSEIATATERSAQQESRIRNLLDEREQQSYQIAQLEAELDESTATVEILRSDLERIVELRGELEERLAAAESQEQAQSETAARLESELGIAQEDIAAKLLQLREYERQMANFKQELEALNGELEQAKVNLSNQIAAAQKRSEQQDTEILTLTQLLQELRREKERQDALLASMENQTVDLQDIITQLRNALTSETESAETQAQEVEQVQSELTVANQRIDALRNQLADSLDLSGQQQTDYLSLQESMAQLQVEIETLSDELQTVQSAKSLLEIRLNESEERNAQIAAKNATLSETLAALRQTNEDMRQSLQSLKQQIGDLDTLVAGLRNELDDRENDLRITNELQTLSESQVSTLQEERRTDAIELGRLRQRAHELQIRLDESQNRTRELLEKEQVLQGEAEVKGEEITSLQGEINRLINDLQEMSQKLRAETARVATKEEQRLQALADIEELKTALGAATEESERRRLLILADVNEAKADSDQARQEVAILNRQVAELRSQLVSLQITLDEAQAKDAKSQVVIESLGIQLNEALAQRALDEVRLRQHEEAERERLEKEKLDLERFRSEFFGQLRMILEDRQGIEVTGDRFVFASEVLFESGEAELSAEGRREIADVARLILELAGDFPKEVDWVLRVDGHTDNRTFLPGSEFSGNWELSQARALSVVQHLIDAYGFPPERLAATGFGEFRPVESNSTVDGRSRNRRIEFKLTEP